MQSYGIRTEVQYQSNGSCKFCLTDERAKLHTISGGGGDSCVRCSKISSVEDDRAAADRVMQ